MESRKGKTIFIIQKRIEWRKSKVRNGIGWHRGSIIPDTFGLEKNNEYEKIVLNFHDFRNEFSNQKLTNQAFSFESKIDLNRKLLGNLLPFKDLKVFEKSLESLDEHYDAGSKIVQEADILRYTDKKNSRKSKDVIMAKVKKN